MKRFYLTFLALLITSQNTALSANKLSLSEFLEKIKAQNLDLKIEEQESNSVKANAKTISLPPPMLAVGKMKEDAGKSSTNIEVSQEIPFPTKISGDYSARKNEAKAQEEVKLARKKEILALAKLFYIDTWATEQSKELLSQRKTILDNHIKLARSSARSDSFASVHVLKTETDRDLLENEILGITQTLKEKKSKIAILLNLDPVSFDLETVDPPISSIPNVNLTENSHQINAANFKLESLKGKELEAKSSWLPDLNLRYRKAGATSMATASNEIMVGVTLPFLFFWEPNSTSKKANADRLKGEYQLEKERREVQADKSNLLSRLQTLKTQIENLNSKLIPRAEKRMKLVHNLAPRDMETLQDHRETMEAFPELKMKALSLRMEYETAIAEIEKYTLDKESIHE